MDGFIHWAVKKVLNRNLYTLVVRLNILLHRHQQLLLRLLNLEHNRPLLGRLFNLQDLLHLLPKKAAGF